MAGKQRRGRCEACSEDPTLIHEETFRTGGGDWDEWWVCVDEDACRARIDARCDALAVQMEAGDAD